MSSLRKPPGHIHKIREFDLEKIHLADEFDILQIVGEGWFGKILLVEHRATDTEMVLKALPKPYVSLRDFYREFHYGLHLGIHKNIVTTFDVAFETAGFYVFTQEYAPLGDLTSNISESGIGELHSKRVAKQIASALDYMHSKDIVHRDVKLDNVLIYRSDFSRVKLCDFGESFRSGTVVERRNEWLPYSPPEVLDIKTEDTYKADPSHDTWQFGIVIFVCLTGCLPWQKASIDDPRYSRYYSWHNTTNLMLPIRRSPKLFKLLSSKASKMFRRFLEPKFDKRPKTLIDLTKFIDDRWLAKGAEKDLAENEQDVLCPSMYSFHSCPEEKNKLLSTLAEHGIETTVDRNSKKARIRDWIESSIITEEDEEEDSGTATSSSTISREPIAGHISSVKAKEAEIKQINTTIKDASNKHFDPRTGAIQDGPSTMGTIYKNNSKSIADIPISTSSSSQSQPQSSSINNNGKNNMSLNSSSLITLASRQRYNDLIQNDNQIYHSEINLNEMYFNDEMTTSSFNQMVNSRPMHMTPSISSSTNTNSNNYYNYDSLTNLDYFQNNDNNKIKTSMLQFSIAHNNSANNKTNIDGLKIQQQQQFNAINNHNNYNNNKVNNNKFQSLTAISISETHQSQNSVQDQNLTNHNHTSSNQQLDNTKQSYMKKIELAIGKSAQNLNDIKKFDSFSLSNNNNNNNNNSDIRNNVKKSNNYISSVSSGQDRRSSNGSNNIISSTNYNNNHQSMKDTPYDYIKTK